MDIERALRGIAGALIIASILLSRYHSPWWLLFTFFVGLNLFQSSFTDWCPMMYILESLGLKRRGRDSNPVQAGGGQ